MVSSKKIISTSELLLRGWGNVWFSKMRGEKEKFTQCAHNTRFVYFSLLHLLNEYTNWSWPKFSFLSSLISNVNHLLAYIFIARDFQFRNIALTTRKKRCQELNPDFFARQIIKRREKRGKNCCFDAQLNSHSCMKHTLDSFQVLIAFSCGTIKKRARLWRAGKWGWRRTSDMQL